MLLKIGSEGEDVEKLQIRLGIEAVGKFGPKTDAAVKEWQSENGLIPDGIVGPKTWAKLFNNNDNQNDTPYGLKLENLEGHIPDSVFDELDDTISRFQISTPLRLAHFLSQCAHESGNFAQTKENLNYSAQGLMKTFKKYFPSQVLAEQYERKPDAIASKVYGGRMGNGPESTKDGYKFRGRGFIQLTGKENYTKFSQFINEDCVNNPDLVSEKYPLSSAAFFFHINNIFPLCDRGTNNAAVTAVTKRVNGGLNGLNDRINHFREFYTLLK